MKSFAVRVLKKLGVLGKISFNTTIILSGRKWKIPIINGIGYDNYLSLSEPWMQFILEKLVSAPSYDKTFVDVGVNLGQTLIKVKSANSTIRYVGFEPNPLCVNYVNALITENSLTNVEIVPAGISNVTGILKLNLFNHSAVDSSASIVEDFRDKSKITKTINVPVFQISELAFESQKKIGIIKIDVEGAELEVLQGFSDRIARDRPLILIEILPAYSADNSKRINRQEKIESLLKTFDYKTFRVIKKDNLFISLQEISEVGIHADMNLCEYILSPAEDDRALQKLLK